MPSDSDPEADPPVSPGDSGAPGDRSAEVLPDSGPALSSDAADDERATVLVVEDNARLRRFLRHLLTPEHHVLEAKNGREGLLRARQSMPSLIVTDVQMPKVDGLTMVDRLRENVETRHIPVLMLTVRAGTEDQREGLERGAVAYVTKPFDVAALAAQIRTLIAHRRQLRARLRRDDAGPDPEPAGDGPEITAFEERVHAAIQDNLADPDFTVEQLAEELGLTRRTLTRKTKSHVGQTPSELIRTTRVEHGARLLAETGETVSQIAYAVGFNSLSYFSRSFRAHFGVSPSSYRTGKT